MPIVDMQRRLHEAGRLRIGEKVPTSNGKTRPSKIDVFRLTSSDERSIRAAALVYGGEVKKWDDAPVGDQWELKTETKSLDVIVPPVDLAWSQWMESWTGGGCTRRCDGQTNVINDTPCACDLDAPECKPTTRLGVILRDLEGIGIWRLQLHGWNGAQELLGTIEVLRTLQARGQMVPARLLLEQRQSKKDGKTFNFAVPVLNLQLSVAALTGSTPVPQLEAASSANDFVPGVTPIQAQAKVDSLPSISEQIHEAEIAPPRARRKNSAAPLPPTGIAPRTAAVAEAAGEAEKLATIEEPAIIIEVESTPGPANVNTSELSAGGASMRSLRRLFAIIGGNSTIPKSEEGRKEWAAKVIDHPVDSFSTLDQMEVNRLSDVASGETIPIDNIPPNYLPDEEPF